MKDLSEELRTRGKVAETAAALEISESTRHNKSVCSHASRVTSSYARSGASEVCIFWTR
jgi:hypothetical protein